MLPEKNGDACPDDLLENAIVVVGESDGKFNTGDYILFYAVGPRPGVTGRRIMIRCSSPG
jgi:hypothetical protein